ncbi:tetratricopeptide repeat protein [Actinophytocola sp.]|uniref:tetratricopeptide repeat protein n=1 Tax=Actinophytocola sp. TaxID=1872138 RepID=UPI0025C292F4|nr:tetratricopeptide repeat protein [Actinophytocola sp.]
MRHAWAQWVAAGAIARRGGHAAQAARLGLAVAPGRARARRRGARGAEQAAAGPSGAALATRANLASVLADLGRTDEALAEHRATLAACVRVLGPEDPGTLTVRNHIGLELDALGRHDEALAEHREHTLVSRNNLALSLGNLGRYEESSAELRGVLPFLVEAFGPEHPFVRVARKNLAEVSVRLAGEGEAAQLRGGADGSGDDEDDRHDH